MAGLDDLPRPWRECFRLAWAAYKAGSVPCGAVVIDGSEAIVGRGRNRTRESAAPPGQLFGVGLAHAEINALVEFPVGNYMDYALYSSLEPCSLCVGAAVMCELGTVRFAGYDMWSGATSVRMDDIPAAKVAPIIEGPLKEDYGIFGSAIYLERLIRIDRKHVIVERHRELGYEAISVAERLFERGVLQDGEVADAELDDIWPGVASLL